MEDVIRNVRTYDHFCLTARALERVGDRWSLLVIRDLLTGPKRFTDLTGRLGGITPKTLSQRLRELEDTGILTADREPGRREVWYRLTPAGADLGPVIEGLNRWGLRHAWRRPKAGEQVHAEHLLRSAVLAIDLPAGEPARWHFRLDGGDYLAEGDHHGWTLTANAPGRPGRRHDHRDHPRPGRLHLRRPRPRHPDHRRGRAGREIPAADRRHGRSRGTRLNQSRETSSHVRHTLRTGRSVRGA